MSENNQFFIRQKGLMKVLFSLLIISILAFFAVEVRNRLKNYDYIGKSAESSHSITIAGIGKVTVIPDIATFTIGVITEQKAVTQAQSENTAKMNGIIAELKKIGIDKEDIKTINYNISPQYDWVAVRQGQRVLRGYQVSQTVLVKIRNLDKIGEVMAKSGELGANDVSGLTFTIDDQEKIKQEAREKALLNAKEKAEALAKVAGVKLGKIVNFSEEAPIYPSRYYNYAMEAKAMGGGDEEPQIEAGSLDITINVTVSYEVL